MKAESSFLNSSQKVLLALIVAFFLFSLLHYPDRLHLVFEALVICFTLKFLSTFWKGYVVYTALVVIAMIFAVYFLDVDRVYRSIEAGYIILIAGIVAGLAWSIKK
ncbi:MAG: hypothetical protein QXT26_04645 [Thermoproteota archaeon]